MNTPNFFFQHPKGTIYGVITDNGLSELHLPTATTPVLTTPTNEFVGATIDARLARALSDYFAGKRESFDAIPLDLSVGTDFQREVWKAARTLAWGETCSYGDLAQRMGRSPGTARAIGQALGANPIPIIVPCHRILACGGKLGGFSGGLDWKRELLKTEQIM